MEKNQSKIRTEIIAEIANSHEGNPEKALELALECVKSGADAVKFQVYFADELLISNHPRYEHFKKQSFNENSWKRIFSELKKRKIKIYCDIFGKKAFNLSNSCNVHGFKLHSSDLNNFVLLDLVKKTNKKVFLSTGGSTFEEIAYAIKKMNLKKSRPILLHGFQDYPTKVENCDLNRIIKLKNIFGKTCDLGYQDHISGSDKMNMVTPIMALSLGARYLEKHVTLDRSKKGVDYYSSLEPKEFSEFVDLVRKSEKTFGSNIEAFSKSEIKYRDTVKKVWFLKKPLKKNKRIEKQNLIMKRPINAKVNPVSFEDLVGKKTNKAISVIDPIKRIDLDNSITAVIVARLKSKRLQRKALKKICGITTIEHLIRRVKQAKLVDKIILCTTNQREDKVLKKIAIKNKINFFRGDNKNVLKRVLGALSKFKSDIAIRITGDDILIDPQYLDKTLEHHLSKNLQYTDAKNLPSGTEVEIFDYKLLKLIYELSVDSSETEYLTYYVKDHLSQFRTGSLETKKNLKKIRLTLDTKKDLKRIIKFLSEMKNKNKLHTYNLNDIEKFYFRNKSLFKIQKKNKSLKIINTNFNWSKIIN